MTEPPDPYQQQPPDPYQQQSSQPYTPNPYQQPYPQQQLAPWGTYPQGPPPGPPQRAPRKGRPVWLRILLAAAGVLVVVIGFRAVGTALAGAGGGSSCRDQVGTWWADDGGRDSYNTVVGGMRSVLNSVNTLGTLTDSSPNSQVSSDGNNLAKAGKQLSDAGTADLGHLPPGCAAQLGRDMSQWDEGEALAGGEFRIAGQELASGDVANAEQSAEQGSADQSAADKDLAAVTADLKVLGAS